MNIRELNRELNKINDIIQEHYEKSIRSQVDFNYVLEESINLISKQADLVRQIGDNLQNTVYNNGGNSHNLTSSLDFEETNSLLRDIKEDLDRIWEKFEEDFTLPIPVDYKDNNSNNNIQNQIIPVSVQNVPLEVLSKDGGINGGSISSGSTSSDSTSSTKEEQEKREQIENTNNRFTNGFNKAASLVQNDINYIIPGVVSMFGGVGIGLGMIISKLIKEAEAYDISSHRFRATTGGFAGGYGSFTNIGLKDAEAYEKLAAYYPANVNLRRSDLEFEKGFNISSGTISSLLRAFREDYFNRELGASASAIGVHYLQELSKIIDRKEVRGYSEEYLKILIDLNQKQLETANSTNSLINSNFIQRVSNLSDRFRNPTILGDVVNSLQSGLTQAKNPQIEALQFYALSQAKPGSSLWEMELMREDPFGLNSVGYTSKFIESLFQTGSIEDVKRNIKETFNFSSFRKADEFVNGILRAKERAESGEGSYQKYLTNGKFDYQKYFETADFGVFDIESKGENKKITSSLLAPAYSKISSEAGAATSEIQQRMAEISNIFAKEGEPLIKLGNELADPIIEVIKDGTSLIGDGVNSLVDLVKYFKEHGIKEGISEGFKQAFKELMGSFSGSLVTIFSPNSTETPQ